MSAAEKKPSEKVLSNVFDGKEIVDALGRKIRLRKPDILDYYDLMSAIGNDSANPRCYETAILSLHVATIDGMVLESPKSLPEFRMNLKRIGEEGIYSLREYISQSDSESDKEVTEKIKK